MRRGLAIALGCCLILAAPGPRALAAVGRAAGAAAGRSALPGAAGAVQAASLPALRLGAAAPGLTPLTAATGSPSALPVSLPVVSDSRSPRLRESRARSAQEGVVTGGLAPLLNPLGPRRNARSPQGTARAWRFQGSAKLRATEDRAARPLSRSLRIAADTPRVLEALFDGSRRREAAAPGDPAPVLLDEALTGHRGHQALAKNRRAAAEALARREGTPERPLTAEEILARPDEWGRRVWKWIVGAQAFVVAPLPEAAPQRAALEAALAKVNARLAGRGLPPVDPAGADVLKDGDPFAQAGLEILDLPDLRAEGAFVDDGRIRVAEGLLRAATPEQASAVLLHEHLALLGYSHADGMRLMQKVTAEAFGVAVHDSELHQLAARAPRGPAQPPAALPAPAAAWPPSAPPQLRRLREFARDFGFLWPYIPVFAALPGLGVILDVKLHGAVQNDWTLWAALAVLAFLPLGLIRMGWLYLRHRLERRAALAERLELGEALFPFDPRTFEAIRPGKSPGVRYVTLEDGKGWLVAVVLRDADLAAGGARVSVEWGYLALRDAEDSGHFFVSPAPSGDEEPPTVHPSLFRRRLLPLLERAVRARMADPETGAPGRERYEAFLRELKTAVSE